MNFNNYKQISELLKSSRDIVISTHKNPDGDTLGSALALYLFLNKTHPNVSIIGVEHAPDFLTWMPNYKEVLNYTDQQKDIEHLLNKADLIVHVDYNAYHRTGKDLEKLFVSSNALDVMIDHHPNPQEGFEAYISDVSACSTAQLVYNLILYMSGSSKLSKDISTCLYVGLITDTGSFSYGMIDEKPYLMAADIVKSGIDDKWIHQQIYSNNTFNRLRLLGYALSEKLNVIEEEHWAYISLEKEELKRFNFQAGDNEGLVNYALSIKGIKAAVLLTEKEDLIRMSFRSKDDFAINHIARNHFDGGGHKNAAGGNSYLSMEATLKRLKNIMSDFTKAL